MKVIDQCTILFQVQFEEWQDVKMCTILINDDSVYEGPETFYVELSSPTYALLGDTTLATVSIYDEEDGRTYFDNFFF